jgi:hypothetical protein
MFSANQDWYSVRMRLRELLQLPKTAGGVATLMTASWSAAHYGDFPLAYLCVALAALWVNLYVLALVARHHERPPVLYSATNKPLVRSSAPYRWWQVLAALVIVCVFSPVVYWIRGTQIDKELESLSGWLYPANEVVAVPCPKDMISPNDVIVLMGREGYVGAVFPVTLLAIGCDKVISLDRDVNGRIALTLTVLDREGKVVVDLERGHFDVNKNNYFKIDRKGSRSTLAVVDQYKQEVLYLHFANKNVLLARALLHYRGTPIRLDEGHSFGFTCVAHVLKTFVQVGPCAFTPIAR